MLFQAKNVRLFPRYTVSQNITTSMRLFEACVKKIAATLACSISLLSTLSGYYNLRKARVQCIMVHVGTARTATRAGQTQKTQLSVNTSQTEKFIVSFDYSYHQH